MLKKKERLNRTEFNRFFSVGKRTHTPYLQIISAPSDVFHGSVVVGKKVYKKAVDRNKVRRQIYNILYQFNKKNQLPRTYIIIAKPAIAGVKYTIFSKVLKKALESV